MRFFDEMNTNVIKIRLVKNHPYRKVLRKAGLVYTFKRPYAVYRELAEAGEQIKSFKDSKPCDVHYVYGDLDTL